MPCDRRLRRQERITEQHEYKQVINTGTVLLGKRFRAYLLVNENSARTAAGFIAGRGVGNACERNRARRLLREAYRGLKPSAGKKGFGVVFVARRGIAGAHLSEIASEMRKMLAGCSVLASELGGGSPRCQ